MDVFQPGKKENKCRLVREITIIKFAMNSINGTKSRVLMQHFTTQKIFRG